jgi:hypothetical protein
MSVKLVAMGLCMAATLGLTGCNGDGSDWKKAQETNTTDGYNAFLAKHPEGEHAGAAVKKIEESDFWKKAQEADNFDEYEAFLVKYPQSEHVAAAIDAMKHVGDRDWKGESVSQGESVSNRESDWKKAQEADKLTPEGVGCSLTSEMTVSLYWSPVAGAIYYRIDSSPQADFANKRTIWVSSSSTTYTDPKVRQGRYGAKLPVYYRVAARRDGEESKPSAKCVVQLLPSKGGSRCQLCGAPAVGYCELRDVYVCSHHRFFTSDEGTRWECP